MVGLGNPGPRYNFTRHNAGFIFLDFLAQGLNAKFTEKRAFSAEYVEADFKYGPGSGDISRVHLLKPLTFMNLSGQSVAAFLKNSQINADNIVVVHDEVEIPFGSLRFKKGGGDAGHNGLKSIRDSLGTGEFYRLRMGVGKDVRPDADLSAYVLGKFAKQDEDQLTQMLQSCEGIIAAFLSGGLQSAQMRASE